MQSEMKMRQPSRRIKIITSCCLFATVSFIYKAQYIIDSTQPPTETANDSLDYVHEGLDNKIWSNLSAAITLKYTKELLLGASADSALQSHLRNSSIKEENTAKNRTDREGYDLYWDELSDGAQVAAQKLG